MAGASDNISAAKSEMAARRYGDALKLWRAVLAQNPDDLSGLVGAGDCLMVLKKYSEACDVYTRAHKLQPDILPLLFALGTAEAAAGQSGQARDHLQQYLFRDDSNADAHKNLAMVLAALGERTEAEEHYRRALELKPDLPGVKSALQVIRKPLQDWQGLFDKGIACIKKGAFVEARDCFQSVLLAQPQNHRVWELLGISELGLGHAGAALVAMDEALKYEPASPGGLHHRAIALRALGRLDEAVAACTDLLSVEPDNAYGHSIRGAIYLETGRILAAVDDLEAALAGDVGGNRPALQGALAFAYRVLCRWGVTEEAVRKDVIETLSGPAASAALMVISPFQVLPLGLDGQAQAEVARRASYKAQSSIGVLPQIKKTQRPDSRLRLGYLSPDFSNHSVASALREVIVSHDRHQFTVEAFSLGRGDDETTSRFRQDFDAFHDLTNMGHGQAAAFIVHRDIDVLIELAGHTRGARPEILAYKPAPVQISAMGYGAPVCADFVPWHLVDARLAPTAARRFYGETLMDMPDNALPASRPLAVNNNLSREQTGLPGSGVLLANFGGSYKIDPYTFDVWMKILIAVPAARLVLLDNTDVVNDRLRQEVQNRSVDPDRLVFVPFVDRADHLARYRYVDLCLDTLTHNGGVTTTDALWLGAPVLTLDRPDLPDRMGPSLLHAARLPELVSGDVEDYVARAISLASKSGRLTSLRQKVLAQQATAPLFDPALYTRNLEAVLLDLRAKAVDNSFPNNQKT